MMHASPSLLIIGIGTDYGRDDAAGLIVARALKAKRPPNCVILEQSGEGARLIEAWQGFQSVVLIDAVASRAKAGTIYRFDAQAQPIPTSVLARSTHAFGVAEAIELARVLNQLPSSLTVYGIEGKCFAAGVGLSPSVTRAAKKLVEQLVQETLAVCVA
ncbi:MAG TPA: hydrogenase maturation protease [Ktedonobacterales bacterium]|nr:hydrogenase maturation protease [Ktedonobacterales bacterium]